MKSLLPSCRLLYIFICVLHTLFLNAHAQEDKSYEINSDFQSGYDDGPQFGGFAVACF